MTTKLLALILCISITGCSTTPTGTQIQQGIVTAQGLATIAKNAYQQYKDEKAGKLTTQQIIDQATADVSGIAALAQAYVGTGKTPTAANLSQGASLLPPAQSIVAALPNQPITQGTVNLLYQSAAQIQQP